MDIKDRKKIVEKLLSKAKEASYQEAKIIKEEANPTYDFIFGHVKAYVLSKFLLSPDCQEENIKALASLSLAKTMKIDKNIIHELDTATPCDHATSQSTKKVLLLYAVQKDMELMPDPEKISQVQTLSDLAKYVFEARQLLLEKGCTS